MTAADEASVVASVTSGTSVDQETWSAFTGQLWDQLWGSDQVKSNSLPSSNRGGGGGPKAGAKNIFESVEEFYSKLPKDFTHQVALDITMTSCSMCRYTLIRKNLTI